MEPTKSLNDMVKRYLVLKERRDKLDAEMEELKAAISATFPEYGGRKEGRTWIVSKTDVTSKRIDSGKVQRILGESRMSEVYSYSYRTQIRITKKKHPDKPRSTVRAA